jgi:hypothetical protein
MKPSTAAELQPPPVTVQRQQDAPWPPRLGMPATAAQPLFATPVRGFVVSLKLNETYPGQSRWRSQLTTIVASLLREKSQILKREADVLKQLALFGRASTCHLAFVDLRDRNASEWHAIAL